jgi:hypothetical protein
MKAIAASAAISMARHSTESAIFANCCGGHPVEHRLAAAERMRDRLPRYRTALAHIRQIGAGLTNGGRPMPVHFRGVLPVSLARPLRLTVPPRCYVVRAAPGLACISTFDLPSASHDRCIGCGSSKSSRFMSRSWRTADLVNDHQPISVDRAMRDLAIAAQRCVASSIRTWSRPA